MGAHCAPVFYCLFISSKTGQGFIFISEIKKGGDAVQRFLKAAGYLSRRIYTAIKPLNEDFLKSVCEIRMRTGKPLSFVTFEGISFLTSTGRVTGIPNSSALVVSSADIKESFQRICEYSVYSYSKDISAGFITVGGGHRAGIYGTAVYDGNSVSGVRDVSGINLRISREFKGCAAQLTASVFSDEMRGLLLCGAPSTGKTTMLRDMARLVSDMLFKKVAVVDERGEIAAVARGTAQNDVGINTDVLDGYRKADGIIQAVRTLSPQLIVCDEIGGRDDCEAVRLGVNSGVAFAAAVHAADVDELKNKTPIMKLIKCGAFEKIAFLQSGKPCCVEKIIDVGELLC